MSMDINTLALNGAVALLIIKEVLAFVRQYTKKKNEEESQAAMTEQIKNLSESVKKHTEDSKEASKELRIIGSKITQLYEWHDVTDSDGVKIWYVRRSLEGAIEKLAESIEMQTMVLKELLLEFKQTKTTVTKLEEDMRFLKEEAHNRSR